MDKIILVIQVVTTSLIFMTLLVYFFQLRTMQHQLDASRNASTGQNIISLVNYLQDESVRRARTIVRQTLRSKEFSSWTEDQKIAASKVCSSYDLAAIIIKQGLVRIEPFIDNWGPSIKDCYDILKPYIEEMQKPENSGPSYWNDFGWLYSKVVDTR